MKSRLILITALLLPLLAGAPARARTPDAPDFAEDVLPVLARAGCNSGACHGAAAGRGGLRLSLLGADPAFDYDNLVREFDGRRVDRARPERSLLLRKPTLDLPHEGGLRITPNGPSHQLLLRWIADGARPGNLRKPVALRLEPPQATLALHAAPLPVRALATLDDGREIDVTRQAVLTPDDPGALRLENLPDNAPAVAPLRPGRHVLMVRHLGQLAALTLAVPFPDPPHPRGAPDPPPDDDTPSDPDLRDARRIDRRVDETLRALNLSPGPPADDLEFLRRAHLDLNGRLPEPQERDAFLRDARPDKRSRLVDALVQRPEFDDLWAHRWADWLRVDSRRLGEQPARAYLEWLRDRVRERTPADRIARELLLARGDAAIVGPANFHRVPADPRAEAELVANLFLGVRLQCANCHDHPLDRWTRDDYHGFAALFAKIDRGTVVRIRERGEVLNPRDGRPARPRIPGGPETPTRDPGDTDDPEAPLAAFAEWLKSPPQPPEQRPFARALANRIWAALLGRGIVHPPDDHRPTNPPSDPRLLDELAAILVERDHDPARLVAVVAKSRTYQRSSQPLPLPAGVQEDSDDAARHRAATEIHLARHPVRPLPPHVRHDLAAWLTGTPPALPGHPPETPARAILDNRVPSNTLELLGRCDRAPAAPCEAENPPAATLPLALHEIHAPWLRERVRHPGGRLARILQRQPAPETLDAALELHRLALVRDPRPDELRRLAEILRNQTPEQRQDPRDALADFLWALLNSSEFVSNH